MADHDWRKKRKIILSVMGWTDFDSEVNALYHEDKKSANEIEELINAKLPDGVSITARSIVRRIKNPRSHKESFNNAIARGRVKFAFKEKKFKKIYLAPKLRLQILTRDGFRCVFCGRDATHDHLEVDHIEPRRVGGKNDPENLRTLCHDCNVGLYHIQLDSE